MVRKESNMSLSDVVVEVAMFINVLVYVYASYYLFNSYSEVKFMYLMFSALSSMVAVLYNSVGHRLTSAALHVASVLFALKVVS
jgi:hypothetical protein